MITRVTKSISKNCTCVRYGGFLLLAMLFMLKPFAAKAQDIDYSFHAKYIYHFTKYIDWPVNKKSGEFVIALVGQSSANKAIKDFFNGKKVGSQTVIVKELSSTADFTGTHIIYVATNTANQLAVLSTKANAAKALLVCEKAGTAKKGADISFFIEDEKLKFELHKSVIENKGLKIAGDLLRLALII